MRSLLFGGLAGAERSDGPEIEGDAADQGRVGDEAAVECGAGEVAVAHALRGRAARTAVTPNGSGEHDERAVLERTIESDRLSIQDRGYAKFTLFNAIVDQRSSDVCRLRDNSLFEVVEERPLTKADRAARVVCDQIVLFGQSRPAKDRPNHPLRLVIVQIQPHLSQGRYKGGSSGVDRDGFLHIATNLLDVPAEILALLYAYRWTIEI